MSSTASRYRAVSLRSPLSTIRTRTVVRTRSSLCRHLQHNLHYTQQHRSTDRPSFTGHGFCHDGHRFRQFSLICKGFLLMARHPSEGLPGKSSVVDALGHLNAAHLWCLNGFSALAWRSAVVTAARTAADRNHPVLEVVIRCSRCLEQPVAPWVNRPTAYPLLKQGRAWGRGGQTRFWASVSVGR